MNTSGLIKVFGIKCDNPSCDYENLDLSINEYKDWIDKECPKCGEILLTESDYNVYKLLTAATSIANKLEETPNLPTETNKIYTPQIKE